MVRWAGGWFIAAALLAGCSAPPEGTKSTRVWSWCDEHGHRVYRELATGYIFVLPNDCFFKQSSGGKGR